MERTEGQTDGQTAVSLNALIPWRRGRKNGHDKWFREQIVWSRIQCAHLSSMSRPQNGAVILTNCSLHSTGTSRLRHHYGRHQSSANDVVNLSCKPIRPMQWTVPHQPYVCTSTCHTKGLFTAHELNWNVLQQGDPVTRHVHWSHASASWFGWKLGRFVLSQIMRCEHCSGNACDVLRLRVHFSSCAVNKL